MSDFKVLSYSTHNSNTGSIKSSLSSGSSSSTRSSSSANNYTDNEIERIKNCGHLFEKRPMLNQGLFREFFNKEPCLYNQVTYSNAARIYHCLKADLNENPILKSLKQQQKTEKGSKNEEKVTEVPRINYEDGQEKRNTLQLAFSTLKFQKVLEDLTFDVEFYGRYPEFKDEESLVSTILFDYMMRKFQLRDKLSEEPLDNHNELVTQIETKIHVNKTNLAAELAKNRIRADALTLEDLLPQDLREVDTHKAELPLYCWINPLKTNSHDLIESLIKNEELKLVESKNDLERKCFMVDPHCSSLLMFHYSLRAKLINHELVKKFKLIIQDKSSCIAPHTVLKLLTKKDDVIITNVGGGLLAAFVGSLMEEYEGKVYAYGHLDDAKYNELVSKFQQIGCNKYIKLMREDFNNSRYDDPKTDNAKIILINAPCTKSALMNPMDFLFQEGEDVKFLKDYTLDANSQTRTRKCVREEMALIKHAFRFPKARAIVYQTYSKNSEENELLVKSSLEDFNENRKTSVFPYKISPPVIPLTVQDIQNEEVVRHLKYLQFNPSSKMNGCFIALLTRDKDAKIDKSVRKAEAPVQSKRSEPPTFQEKNFLYREETHVRKTTRKKSISNRKKSTPKSSVNVNKLEREIEQLTLQHEKSKRKDSIPNNIQQLVDPLKVEEQRRKSFDRISQIGKLDPKKLDMYPNRSSTPNKLEVEETVIVPIQLKNFSFRG